MAGEQDSGEKTEEPTHKKLEKAREKGQVWKSRDFTGLLVFIVGLGALRAAWPWMEAQMKNVFLLSFSKSLDTAHLDLAVVQVLLQGLITVLLLSLPIALASSIAGGMSDFLQVGPLFSAQAVTPKLDKLNIVNGFKNLFSKKQAVEGLKALLKTTLTAYVVYGVYKGSLGEIVSLFRGEAKDVLPLAGNLVFKIAVRVGLLYLLFGMFDLWFQRRVFRKEMMMTKEEVKREYKESEGDPHYKYKRKQMHQEILESQQMEAVKNSTVVVTNPTHLAVALLYHPGAQAPVVVARGADALAQKMKRVAMAGGIPTVENVPLARAMFALPLGALVPESLYTAVAEVLIWIRRIEHSRVAESGHSAVNGTPQPNSSA